MYILLPALFHYGLSQDAECSSLCCTVGPWCLSILYLLSPLLCLFLKVMQLGWHIAFSHWLLLFSNMHLRFPHVLSGFLRGSVVNNLPANAADEGLIPGWGRSPSEGNDNQFYCSCLGNPTDRGAWHAALHGCTRVGHGLATKQQQPVLSWPDCQCLFLTEQYRMVCIYYSSFICSPTERHLGCFRVLAVTNKESTNIYVQAFVST